MRRLPFERPVRTVFALAALAASLLGSATALGQSETCTTQSALPPAERSAIADAARRIASAVIANDAAVLRTAAAPELAKDFGALQYLVATTSPRLTGHVPVVSQVYVLDATKLKPNPDGSAPEAQFFCSLNRTTAEVEFDIPSLPAGRYGFAIVDLAPSASNPVPWRISFLLRQDPPGSGAWLLSGLYPRQLTAAGHDGLWYWEQARQFAKTKQSWNAWIYYQTALRLVQPAPFLNSSHLEKLRSEASTAAPPALSEGITPDAPLVVKGANGAEFHFTSLAAEDVAAISGQVPAQPALDVVTHFATDPLPDPAAARQRNLAAAAALLNAYPELRKPFHGVAVYADAKGQPTVSSEFAMAEIH